MEFYSFINVFYGSVQYVFIPKYNKTSAFVRVRFPKNLVIGEYLKNRNGELQIIQQRSKCYERKM